uniref:Alkylated DNA repair protein AlkB homologue 8 N-terminal domain-containing protein n=1 Tax=Knipowitschia caucasica TaxID=637954 RepID=A0AAV2MHQ2_KNICA
MIVDFRKSTVPPPPPSVMDSPITSVESFRFLGTTITQDLKWEPTISSLIKKAQQRMYFLRQLRKAKLPAQMLVQFYTAIIESILTSSITVWFAGATVRDKRRLQRIVRSAEEVIGRSLPSLQDLIIQTIPSKEEKRGTQQQHQETSCFHGPLEVCGGVWRSVEAWGGVWRSVEECGGLGRSVEACGGVWRSVEAWGGVWRSVEVCGGLGRSVEAWGGVWRPVEAWGGVCTRAAQSSGFEILQRDYSLS